MLALGEEAMSELEQFEMPRLPGGKIDMDTREQILSRYMEGANQKEIAEEFKVSRGTVKNIVKNDERATAIRENKIDYDAIARVRVLNKGFAVVESLIERCTDEFRLKALVDTLNVLVHTRRIEEGLSGASAAGGTKLEMTFKIEGGEKFVDTVDSFPELSQGDQMEEDNPIDAEIVEEPLPSKPVDDYT